MHTLPILTNRVLSKLKLFYLFEVIEVRLNSFKKNEAFIVVLPSQIMMVDCNEIREEFTQIISDSDIPVIVDCCQLDFIDSSGLGALVYAYQIAKSSNIHFLLFNLKPTVLSLLELTQLDQVLTICTDEEAVFKFIEAEQEQVVNT